MLEPEHVTSWCLTHSHRIELAQDPLYKHWVLYCVTCTHDPLVSHSTTSDE
jgi:hypothetical protein